MAETEKVYDSNGNRTITGYTTGDHNRLLTDGTYTYQYDNEGNRTARFVDNDSSGTLNSGDTSITEYEWDHRNRLTKVTERSTYGGAATKIVEYAYDYGQRWVRKTLDTDADGTIEESQVFVHSGGQIVLDFQKTGTADASNSDLAHRYLWGANTDDLLANETADDATEDDVAWALTDHLGSVRDLVVYDPVTQTVSVVKHVVYDAYGNVTSDTATGVESLFLYTARPFDSDTALQNNLNRWYDATTGRWLSTDPIGFEAGDVNLYRYVGNGPLRWCDASGFQTKPGNGISPIVGLPDDNDGKWPPSLKPPAIADPDAWLAGTWQQAFEQGEASVNDLIGELEKLGYTESVVFSNALGSSKFDVYGKICDASLEGIDAKFGIKGLGTYDVKVMIPPEAYEFQLAPHLNITVTQSAEIDLRLGYNLDAMFQAALKPDGNFKSLGCSDYNMTFGGYASLGLGADVEYTPTSLLGPLTLAAGAGLNLATELSLRSEEIDTIKFDSMGIAGIAVDYKLYGGVVQTINLPKFLQPFETVTAYVIGSVQAGYRTVRGPCALDDTVFDVHMDAAIEFRW